MNSQICAYILTSKVFVYQNDVILDKFSKSCLYIYIYILTVKRVNHPLIYQNDVILNKFCKIKKIKYYINSQNYA